MTMMDISFDLLYERCLYSSLAHAVYVFREPFFSFEQSWDGQNYSFCDGSTRGTISFRASSRIASGAARDDLSSRRSWYPQKQALALFSSAPEENRSLARSETLEYLYDTVEGTVCPVATVAMWHDGSRLFLSDEEPVFVRHGGRFLLLLSDPSVDLAAYWEQQYSLSADEMLLIDELRKFVHSDTPFELPTQFAKRIGKAQGLDEGLTSLQELGIAVRMKRPLF